MIMPRNYYIKRLLARGADILLIIVISSILDRFFETAPFSFFSAYLLYNFTVILFGGESFGKYIFSLKLNIHSKGLKRRITLLFREILILLLFPILSLNALMLSPLPLHDAILKTRIIQD